MDEHERDQVLEYGKEPADDFPSERDVPLSVAHAPETRTVWRSDTEIVVLSSDAYAENEFLSEHDPAGYTAGSLLEIVPAQSVRNGSLAASDTGPAPHARGAAEAAPMVPATSAAWLKVTPIGRVSMGLAVVALGAAIYATLPDQLAVTGGDTTNPIAVDSVFPRAATVPALGPTSDPTHPELNSREASVVAGPNAAQPPELLRSEIASRPEGFARDERRSAVTIGRPENAPERPLEGLVDQLRSTPDTSVVTGALPVFGAPLDPRDEAARSTDVVSRSTTSQPSGAEPATVPLAAERLAEVPPALPTARDAGKVVVPPVAAPHSVVVQAVLARYAQAYARLDASAVKDIWPTVDERALARAFSGLEAQSIMFDACDLTIDGTRATAACRGTATYVTGVGKRSNVTQPRQWTFLLEQSPESWEIQRIQIR